MLIAELDDFPEGFAGGSNWPRVAELMFVVVQYRNARYRTLEWKLQHRRHARESVRRARADPAVRAKRNQKRRELYAAKKAKGAL